MAGVERPELTEAEQDSAGKVMLRAAVKAFGKFPQHGEDEDIRTTARLVVKAMAAASRAKTSLEDQLSKKYGSSMWVDAEPAQVVATAFWVWSDKPDLDLSEISGNSVVGARLLGLAQGLSAARAVTDAFCMIDDDASFSTIGDGAEFLESRSV